MSEGHESHDHGATRKQQSYTEQKVQAWKSIHWSRYERYGMTFIMPVRVEERVVSCADITLPFSFLIGFLSIFRYYKYLRVYLLLGYALLH